MVNLGSYWPDFFLGKVSNSVPERLMFGSQFDLVVCGSRDKGARQNGSRGCKFRLKAIVPLNLESITTGSPNWVVCRRRATQLLGVTSDLVFLLGSDND